MPNAKNIKLKLANISVELEHRIIQLQRIANEVKVNGNDRAHYDIGDIIADLKRASEKIKSLGSVE